MREEGEEASEAEWGKPDAPGTIVSAFWDRSEDVEADADVDVDVDRADDVDVDSAADADAGVRVELSVDAEALLLKERGLSLPEEMENVGVAFGRMMCSGDAAKVAGWT